MRAVKTSAIVLAFTGLTVAMTWPLLSPTARLVPDSDDAYFSVWRLAWVAHQLPRDPWHLFDANIFHPSSAALAYSDAMLLVSAAGGPAIWSGVSPAVVHNMLIGAAFVSSMWFAFMLARDLTGSARAAWLAAIFFGFAPYRFAHIGHLELQWVMWMPLSLWALHRYVTAPTARRALAVGGAVAAQTLCSIYYGVFLSFYLVVAALILCAIHPAGRRRAMVLTPVMIVPLVVVLAIYGPPYLESRQQHGARKVSEISEFSARPADFLRVPPRNRWRGHLQSGDGPDERSLFPGTAPLLLAAAAFVPPVAPSAWVYLGLTTVSADAALGMNGLLFPVLQRLVPPLTSLRAPARFGVLVLLSVSILAAYGAAKIVAARPRVATPFVAMVTLLSLAEFWSSPLLMRVNQESPTEAHRWLSRQPAGTVVVEMPVPTNETLWLYETTYLVRSMHHWQRLVNGYSAFAPREYRRTLEALKEFPDDRSVQRLRELNVRFVLLNRVSYTGEEFADLIARLTGSPAFWPSQSFGDGDNQIIIVELKGAAPPP